MTDKILLSIVEMGGYGNLQSLYERTGYTVETVTTMRKAMSLAKKIKPVVIVAEFNYQSDFRDRTSNLESLLATVQRLPDTRVLVIYEKEYVKKFEKMQEVFPVYASFSLPIDIVALEKCLQEIR